MSKKDLIQIPITVEIPERWKDSFLSFLKELGRNGNIGHSEVLGFFCDGDGDFRAKFDFDIEYKKVNPSINKPERIDCRKYFGAE